jgi:hypothetical protein
MHPYSDLPDQNFWRRLRAATTVARPATGRYAQIPHRADPTASAPPAAASPSTSRAICAAPAFRRLQAEVAHPLLHELGAETASYDLFSARYGNIYTARQCLELFRQAFGLLPVIHDYAEDKGRYYDLLRPNAVPDGFSSRDEAAHDRTYHLACVRHMFSTSNVFVLTLGLTESWYHAELGHTYPVCPGTARGEYQPQLHQFRNLTHAEVTDDLEQLVAGLRQVNPGLKLILTVSPVPLVATYTNNNVLVASSYSKSVLRAAAGEVEARHAHVAYFPSYEIISWPAAWAPGSAKKPMCGPSR